MTQKKRPPIFEIINRLTETKEPINFDDKELDSTYSVPVINKWLSYIESYIPVVAQLNNMNIPKEIHAMVLQDEGILPSRRVYCKYLGKPKEDNTMEIKYLCHYFQCNVKEAEAIYKKLGKKEVDEILSKYRYGFNKWIPI